MHNILVIFLSVFYISDSRANFNFLKDLSLREVDWKRFSKTMSRQVFSEKQWPEVVTFNEKNYKINYTFDEKLTSYVKRELGRYGSDYASIVVMDNNTGKILTAIDYTKKTRKFGKNLTFSSTNPAASVFKVITAAEILENSKIDHTSNFTYNGRATTLYKYQLKDKKNRWTRKIKFEKAFARSNNVVFGKAAIKNTTIEDLTQMAENFGFNKKITQLVDLGSSSVYDSETEFGLAELASGFNRQTLMSPIHGALIASIIANDGILKKPTVVSDVKDVKWEREIWSSKVKSKKVLSLETSREMQILMEATVKRGTARGAFRPWKTKKIRDIRIGGKTGTITGGLPMGKRDWFVSYAIPKEGKDSGISVCVMIVNVNKWYIKSTALAKNIIEYYYSR